MSEAQRQLVAAANEVRSELWEEALRRNFGNITHASNEFGFTKQRGWTLARRHGLLELAKNLRLDHGQPATGRPPL